MKEIAFLDPERDAVILITNECYYVFGISNNGVSVLHCHGLHREPLTPTKEIYKLLMSVPWVFQSECCYVNITPVTWDCLATSSLPDIVPNLFYGNPSLFIGKLRKSDIDVVKNKNLHDKLISLYGLIEPLKNDIIKTLGQ